MSICFNLFLRTFSLIEHNYFSFRLIKLVFGIDQFPGYVGPEVGIVIAPSGGHLPADPADVRLVPRMDLEVVGQVVAPGELLATGLALIVPRS